MSVSSSERAGGRLCGEIRFTALPKDRHLDACGCGMCRRWSASPFMVVDDPSAFPLEVKILIDRKPPTYAFSDATRQMTEAEFFAAMGGAGG